MILDFAYNRNRRQMNVSYITERGSKAMLEFNVSRFKSYWKDPNGKFTNWDGDKCSEKWVERPGLFEYLTFLHELPERETGLILGKYNPKLYTWDIETKFDPKEFPDPTEAKFPITVISVASEGLDVVELGTMDLRPEDQKWVQDQITEYLRQSDFYNSLNLPEPKFRYLKFDTEMEMISYFLTNLAAKAPVLAGWNSDGFDSLYIQNRMAGYYPSLSMKLASPTGTTTPKRFQDMKGNKYILQKPDHTLMVDMMDVVENYDLVLGNKETLALDYIARKCAGIGKIEYDGDLEHLRQTDYKKYVFYSCIDSILVQLISKKLRTLNNIYAQSLYCKTKIGAAFSKIAISEAVVFDYFFNHDIKVVSESIQDRERPELVGAYVMQPVPGKRNWVCCNDFASLYPSAIASCNLSFENYLGSVRDGKFQESELDRYRQDPNYFVSVNGSVYKNDKAYAFKEIQIKLKAERNVSKYLAKSLYAHVMADCKHLASGRDPGYQDYKEQEVAKMAELGYDIHNTADLEKVDLRKFMYDLDFEIEYLQSFEQACKLVMNSMYGGSSHVAFHWFNIDIANDITGEGRNLIHKMEAHIPEWMDENWAKLTDIHKQLGITLKKDFPHKGLIQLVGGDTDSVVGSTIIPTNNGNIRIEELFNQSLQKQIPKMTPNGTLLVESDQQVLNWGEPNQLHYTNIKYISKHKVSKKMWRLRTKSGKEVVVTEDHSLVVFRDGQKVVAKAKDIMDVDKVLSIYPGPRLEDIECCECIGETEEYVYDIEVEDDSHTFIANDILVHNSLYTCYNNWVKSINHSEDMSMAQIRDLIVQFNTGFLDQHNKEFMDEYYRSRHVESIHKFELETVAYADIRLDVKKRYAQMLIWKDGYCPDTDNLPFKSKGLETIKASYPELARKQLQGILEKLLMSEKDGPALTHFLNQIVQQDKQEWMVRPVEELCENKGINGYTKYIVSDSNPAGVEVALKCPYHIKALANRNWTIRTKGVRGELQYGGKMKIYPVRKINSRTPSDQYFAFMAGEYPVWAEQYWPVDRYACFQKFYLDPLNRILSAIGQSEISITGYIQTSLF